MLSRTNWVLVDGASLVCILTFWCQASLWQAFAQLVLGGQRSGGNNCCLAGAWLIPVSLFAQLLGWKHWLAAARRARARSLGGQPSGRRELLSPRCCCCSHHHSRRLKATLLQLLQCSVWNFIILSFLFRASNDSLDSLICTHSSSLLASSSSVHQAEIYN